MVRFGFRGSLQRNDVVARTSLKRYVRNNLGLKAPSAWVWITNQRKAAYNRVYSRTTRGCLVVLGFWFALACGGFTWPPCRSGSSAELYSGQCYSRAKGRL